MIPSAAFATEHVDKVYSEVVIEEATYNVSLINNSVVYNNSVQAPTLKLTKSGGGTYEGAAPVLSYIDKGNKSASYVTNAGTYKVIAIIGSDKWYVGDFTIKPYDLNGISISIDNQTSAPSSVNTMPAGAKYYRGSTLLTEGTSVISNGLTVTMTNVGKRYTVSFDTVEDGNYVGTVSPTSFDIVSSIEGNASEIREKKGNSPIEQINAGEYTGTEKNVKDLFELWYKGDSSTATKQLDYGKDYTFTCPDKKNVGNHTVTIQGKGEYGGTKTLKLVITARDADTCVKAEKIEDQTVATKSFVEPVLKDTKLGVTLVKDKDYYITSRRGEAGETGYVTVAFKGNYAGTALDIPFNVVSDDKNVEKMDVYYGSEKIEGEKAFPNAYMYNNASQPVKGITVYKDSTDYKNNKSFSTSYYDVVYDYSQDGKTVSTTAPKEATTYSVYIVGKNGYAGKKLVGTYKIPKFDIKNTTITVSAASATATPSVTVKSIYDNITFVKDKDYTVTSSSYVSNGKIWVTISPKETGNLTGSPRSDYYPVSAKSISSCRVYFTNGRNSASYTGSSIVVDVRVEDGYYNILRERTDYTISYKLNGKDVSAIKDAGTYTIEIKGINGYTGTTSLTFTVIGTDISGYTVTLKESSVNATGYSQTPVITSVKKGTYYSLSSSDYTVTYQDSNGKTVSTMSAPGTYKVVVTGKNGYSGSTSASFRIVGLPQTVTVNQDSYKVYDDSDVFKITAKATGDGTGFTYTSSNPAVASVSSTGYVTPHKVGKAVITVTTTGNKKSEPTSKEVIVKVYPDKVKISKKPWTDGKKAQMKVRWGYQDGVTKYQVRYSRDKNFKSGTYLTKTVKAHGKDYTTQSTTISKLKRGYTYYFKVRAVYTDPVTGENYYGSWSPWRSAKTK